MAEPCILMQAVQKEGGGGGGGGRGMLQGWETWELKEEFVPSGQSSFIICLHDKYCLYLELFLPPNFHFMI